MTRMVDHALEFSLDRTQARGEEKNWGVEERAEQEARRGPLPWGHPRAEVMRGGASGGLPARMMLCRQSIPPQPRLLPLLLPLLLRL